MTLKEAAAKWGIGDRGINTLCIQGRVPDATKPGNMWAIPVNTKNPNDARIKSSRYIKQKG